MKRSAALRPGWRLFKPRADAASRRASLEPAADELNGSVQVPPAFDPFSVRPCRADLEETRDHGQVGASPSRSGSQFELRATLRFRDRGRAFAARAEKQSDEASEMRSTLEEFGTFDPAQIEHMEALLRGVVDRAIARSDGLAFPARLSGFGGCPTLLGRELYLTVDLVTVGADLQAGIDRVSAVELGRLEADLAECVSKHIRLEGTRAKAAAAGLMGWIDGAALRILAESGLGLGKALELLRRSSFITLSGTVGDRPRMEVQLGWLDGVLRGALRPGKAGFGYHNGLLKLKKLEMPDTLLLALPGRRLDALVTHPLLPTDPTIREIREKWDGLHVAVDEVPTPITPDMLQPDGPEG